MARYLTTGTKSLIATVNTELEKIATSQEDFLSRIGEAPNQMEADLDMNSNRILNVPAPYEPTDVVRLKDIPSFTSTPLDGSLIKYFSTVDIALGEGTLVGGDVIGIKETITNDPSLIFWDVVATSSVTPNSWNIRTLTSDPELSIVLRGSTDFFFNKAYKDITFFGHRGALLSAPQSTMAAFSQSIASGMDGLEFDVQTDSEGQIWVFHDPNLSPDTQLIGAISDSTTAYVETAVRQEANGTRLDGIGIMKLEEVLEYASSKKLPIAPEMKFTGWTDGNVDALVQVLDNYGYNNDQCYLSAVDVSLLERVRYTSQTVIVTYGLNTDFATAKADIDRVIALGNGAIAWYYIQLLEEPEFITYAFANGLDVIAWVVEDTGKVQELIKLGVRNFMSDTYLGGTIARKPNNNSMGLSFGKYWENTKQYLLPYGATTTAAVSISGETLTCTAPTGESSKASRHVNVEAGEVVTFAVLARLTAGTEASIGIDYPTAGNLLASTSITSHEWQWYEVSCIIPLTAISGYNCVLQAGIFGSMEGTVEFRLPRVMKGNIQRGSTQNLAMGQIYFDTADSNTPKVNKGFSNNGIYALSYDTGAKELSITIDKVQRDDPEGTEDITASLAIPVRPSFHGDVDFDNNGYQLHVKFGSYVYTTGVVKARFYDQTNTLVDITSYLAGGNIYMYFKAEVN